MHDVLTALNVPWPDVELMTRILLAAILGGVVGLEREWSGKPAGFRTNLLICVGAALLTDLSVMVARSADPSMTADPARIAAQIVSGMGFLGAGTIIQSRGSVTGLTTAATLWVVAAVGMTVGVGAYAEAVGATVLVMLALLALGRLEPRLSQHVEHRVQVTLERDGITREAVEAALGARLEAQVLELERKEARLSITYRVRGRRKHFEPMMDELLALDGVRRVGRD